MGKSYVGMAKCPVCGKDSGIVMDKRLKDTFEDGEYYAQYCKECNDVLVKGGKFIIEVEDDTESDPQRTGRLWGIKGEAFDKMFPRHNELPVAFVEKGACAKIGLGV